MPCRELAIWEQRKRQGYLTTLISRCCHFQRVWPSFSWQNPWHLHPHMFIQCVREELVIVAGGEWGLWAPVDLYQATLWWPLHLDKLWEPHDVLLIMLSSFRNSNSTYNNIKMHAKKKKKKNIYIYAVGSISGTHFALCRVNKWDTSSYDMFFVFQK